MTQRQIQNQRARGIRDQRRADGLCVTCASKSRPGKCQCKECSDKGKERYKERNETTLFPKHKKEQERAKTKFTGGVYRHVNKDGYGREGVWFLAMCQVNGKKHARRWSVDKYGHDSAKLLATLQKMMWMIEGGAWRVEDGDPLAILNYAESFSGNKDYEDCVIDHRDVSSPWIRQYEDIA